MAKKPTQPTTEKPTAPADAATKATPKVEISGTADTKPETSPSLARETSQGVGGAAHRPKAEATKAEALGEKGKEGKQFPPAKTVTSRGPDAASPQAAPGPAQPESPKSESTRPEPPGPERPSAPPAAAPKTPAPLLPVQGQGIKPAVPEAEVPKPKAGAAAGRPLSERGSEGAPPGRAAEPEPSRPTADTPSAPLPPSIPEQRVQRLPAGPAGRLGEPAAEPPVEAPVEPLAEPPVERGAEQARPHLTGSEPTVLPESAPAPSHHHEQRPSLYVVHVTPEMAPVAKVGGLADVVFGLSRELAIRGNHVEIILPKYDNLRYDHIFQMHEVYNDLWVPWYEGAIHCTVYFSFVHDRKCFFIEPHSQDNFFNRGSLYGFKDDVLRFAFFSRAAMEFLWKAGKHPDIIHCHDWQTALVPVFLYELYQPLGMHHPRVCLTIHNFLHQGVTGVELLRATGLHRPERFMAYERLGDNNHRGALNLLKGGIVYSNFIATVSPRYAFETKDSGQGFGLEPTLHTHHMKYGGVVNGVDYDVWNPEVDHHIPVRYGVDSIDGKYENKRALRHRFMLADNEKPIVAFIGRLDPQKGLELVRHAIFYALEKGTQFVLLGSSPDPRINADFWGLKNMLNDSPDCHLELGFDEDLSHLIYAGADMMLVPSQFEPCGLTQLIALRYGTVPVVRSVGGLADTVFDKDHSLRPLHERNGYSFETYDAQGLESALGRAIACYYNHPDHFRELMKNAMRSDNSWNHPGQDYMNIYDFIRHR